MQLQEQLLLQVKPSLINYNVSLKCNGRCLYCSIWKKKEHKEKDISFFKLHILRLRKWIGPFILNISGGEPLLNKKIYELVEFFNYNDIKSVISTNASLLDISNSKKLIKAGVDIICISLDGFENEHDFLRGIPGLFKKILKSVAYLKSINPALKIYAHTVLCSRNLHRIPEFTEWMMKEKSFSFLDFQAISSPFGEPENPDWYLSSELWPTNKQEITNAFEYLLNLKKSSPFIVNSEAQLKRLKEYFLNPQTFRVEKCYVGSISYCITATGKIFTCPFFDPIGNIEESPEEIWNSAKNIEQRKKCLSCKKNCHMLVNCAFEDRVLS